MQDIVARIVAWLKIGAFVGLGVGGVALFLADKTGGGWACAGGMGALLFAELLRLGQQKADE